MVSLVRKIAGGVGWEDLNCLAPVSFHFVVVVHLEIAGVVVLCGAQGVENRNLRRTPFLLLSKKIDRTYSLIVMQ